MIEKQKLQGIVGKGNVSSEAAVLESYSHDISFVNRVRPACVVKPKTASEIKEIVKLANETQTPLVPVSSGPPHFRGDTVPGAGGAVVVDLSGMKKIFRVDREHRVAMVEPGVTFGELIPEAEKVGLKLNMPLAPRKTKSVVGSLLEREPIIMPKYQWDVSDPLACVEVIWGTGDEFRTGQAAGPGTIEEQWAIGAVQKAPYGPGIASLHRLIQGSQGTMGIVTWASMRCELLPSLEEPFVVCSSNLNSLMEMAAWLVRLRIANECLILNNTDLAALFAKQWPQDFLGLKSILPEWTLFYTLAGYEFYPEERISSYIKSINSMTQRLCVEPVKSAGGISANEIMKKVRNPSEEPYWKMRYKGSFQDVLFLTINDKLENLITIMKDLTAKAGYPVSEIGIYIQPVVQGTGCHCEFTLFYDAANPVEYNRVKTLSTNATRVLMSQGAFFSRPYGEEARLILNKDAATVSILNKLKKIFDPNNIMNPGKICF